MQQARLVAGFQHLPSEESAEESLLIHPGHTSISSLCTGAGFCWFFFRLLSRFDICWGDQSGAPRFVSLSQSRGGLQVEESRDSARAWRHCEHSANQQQQLCASVSPPKAGARPTEVCLGCKGESLLPAAAQNSSWGARLCCTALLHGSVHCTALLQGSVCCTVSSTCLGCSRNPDFQQLTCHSSLLHADFSKRMSQLWSRPKTVEKKQQWEPVINVMMVIVQARGWSKPVPSTALQLDPLWMVTGWDTAGIASCMGLLSPDRQSSPDLGH